MTIAAASSTNWADAMDFHAAMMCPIGVPALACCALDGTLRTSTSNRCSLSCSSRCFQRCPACSCSWNTATTRSGRWWRLHFLPSTGSADAPRARVARIARVAPHNTRTHNHIIAATAAVSAPGGAAGTQRSSAAEGDWRRRVRRVQRICGFGRAFAGLTDLAAAGRSSGARRAAEAVRGQRGRPVEG